ncbi:MAG: M20/M25/M40 family metallo-hydrolase [Gracilimonas sp.]
MMYNFKLLLVLTTFLLLLSCSKPAEITEQNVTRIIQTLSADNMKGRHAFSEEIHLAADFISNEFDQIGLSPLPENSDFKQEFTIHSVKPAEASISINGQNLENEYYFSLVLSEELNWTTGDASVKYISKEDSYRDKFSEFNDDNESSIIAVSTDHAKWFHRYRTYFGRSNRTFEINTSPNDIFVLADERITEFDIDLEFDIEPIKLFNIVGMIEGERTDEIVLFSAHYDHIGVITPANEDSVANGANDNASGISGLIELARYYESRDTPQRTIYFVAFTAEEVGGYGSKYFSQQIEPEQFVTMINMEMIGKPATEGPNTAWITGFEHSSLGDILQESTQQSDFEFYPDPYPSQNLFYRSDNAPFAEMGIPAHSISTTPIDVDQDYHRVTDELKTLHIPHTTNTIRAVAKACETIISGEKTPTRIAEATQE